MAILRQYIAPLLIVLVFLFSLVAVSARIFLPADMAAPAPIEDPVSVQPVDQAVAELPLSLSTLVKGIPDDPALANQVTASSPKL